MNENDDDFVANDTPRNGEYYAKIARRIQEAEVPPLAAGANQEGRVQNILISDKYFEHYDIENDIRQILSSC